jgi:hypothetical protein
LDAFVASYDSDGNHRWSERYGDAATQRIISVAVGAGGHIVVAGAFEGTLDFGNEPMTSAGRSDAFLAKLDAMGRPIWTRRFGDDSTQWIARVALDGGDNVIIATGFEGSFDFGCGPHMSAGDRDVLVAALNGAGNHLWSATFGDADSETASGLAVGDSGDVVIAGQFEGGIDFGGTPLLSTGKADVFLAKLHTLP